MVSSRTRSLFAAAGAAECQQHRRRQQPFDTNEVVEYKDVTNDKYSMEIIKSNFHWTLNKFPIHSGESRINEGHNK